MGLVDGLGFEEIGQAGSQPSQIWVTGSIVTDSIISGLNVYGQLSGTFARINNANGLIESIRLESGATTRNANVFGGFIKVGNTVTAAGSGATVIFAVPFNVGSYAIFFSAAAATSCPIIAATSGALRASGCEIIGAASTSYNWLALGA